MLPIFKSEDKDLMLLQTKWSSQLNKVIDSAMSQGQILKDVSLVSGANIINHKLGRKLIGWYLTRVRANVTVFDTQDTNQMPDLTLTLTASGNVTVDIFVF